MSPAYAGLASGSARSKAAMVTGRASDLAMTEGDDARFDIINELLDANSDT